MPRRRPPALVLGLASFAVLFLVSAALSRWAWARTYTGWMRDRVFRAVLFGNLISSAAGGLLVAVVARWRR